MKAAYDIGVNFFDCAEGYAGGESEKVMDEAIKKFGWKRNDIVVSTKVSPSLQTLTCPPTIHRFPNHPQILILMDQ
jgi:aryl-alcohol dehydrogenase-like predicted oxidoreductase